MDINECHRLLELEIGASREAVDAAFRRLTERWSPDRAAAGGPEAVREAQRMVQALNEAHQTLLRSAAATKPPFPPPAGAPAGTGTKPTLRPLHAGPPPASRSPSPPPSGTGTPPVAPAPGDTASSAPPPATKSFPPPPVTAAPFKPAAAPAPVPASAVAQEPVTAPAPEGAVPPAAGAAPGLLAKVLPPGSPQRRLAPVVIVVLLLLLGKSVWPTEASKTARAREVAAAASGGLVVKSNRTDAAIAAKRIAAPGEAASAEAKGVAGQAMTGLAPGKYAVTARADGWPEIHGETSVDTGRTTELALNFKGGSLRLDSDPSGAAVRLGEETLGKTPLVIPDLPPGECRLTLEYPAWPALTFKTTITADVEATATVHLPHGKLTVESSPSGATVLLGGRAYGQTPLIFERISAGTKKLTLEAKDFPPLELSVAVDDGADLKIHPSLGSAFPVLDPEELLRSVWVPDNPDKLAPPNDGMSGPSAPRNDIVKNLNRKRLYEGWLRRRYCLTAVVKAYDKDSGLIEFAEGKSELSRYRVLAKLGPEAFKDKDLLARLAKGATVALYGQLTAVEEPRWPFRVITLELSAAEPLR